MDTNEAFEEQQNDFALPKENKNNLQNTTEKPLNPSGHAPSEQGSDTPLAWKQSRNRPVPVTRCIKIKKDGTRCGAWSMRFFDKCWNHLGRGGLPNIAQYQESMYEEFNLRMLGVLPEVFDHHIDLIRNAESDAVRLQGVKEYYSVIGIKAADKLDVTVTTGEDPTQSLIARLSKIKAKEIEPASNPEIHDAEIVEETE